MGDQRHVAPQAVGGRSRRDAALGCRAAACEPGPHCASGVAVCGGSGGCWTARVSGVWPLALAEREQVVGRRQRAERPLRWRRAASAAPARRRAMMSAAPLPTHRKLAAGRGQVPLRPLHFVRCRTHAPDRRPLRGPLLRPPDRRPARGAAAADDQGRRLGAWSTPTPAATSRSNWMTPPTVDRGEPTARSSSASTRARTGWRSGSPRCSPTSTHDMGEAAGAREGRRRARPAGAAGGRAAVVRRGLPARAPRVADRHRPGRPDVPRRARTAGSRSRSSASATIDAVEQLTRYLERIRLDPAMADCRGVLAAQVDQAAGARAGRGARASPGSRSTSPCCAASASRSSRCSRRSLPPP